MTLGLGGMARSLSKEEQKSTEEGLHSMLSKSKRVQTQTKGALQYTQTPNLDRSASWPKLTPHVLNTITLGLGGMARSLSKEEQNSTEEGLHAMLSKSKTSKLDLLFTTMAHEQP